MINPETNKSKGYAFIEFTNYKEFQTVLNYPEPIILGKQKLVFNSAKNRYDSNQNNISEKKDNPNINNNNVQINNAVNNNDFNHNNYLLTHNKDSINIRISGISDSSTNNSSTNSSYNSTSLGIKQKENFSKLDSKMENSPLNIQIKYALKNMANFYGNNNPFFCNSKICNYYCSPFLDKEIFNSNYEAVFNGSSMNQV